jgi:single-strand DNA-binding protein
VVIFNENFCRVAEQYLKKGSKVYIEGQLQTRKYTDQQGVEKFSTEVVLQQFRGELTMLDTRPSDGGARGAATISSASPGRWSGRARSAAPAAARDLDDEVPF